MTQYFSERSVSIDKEITEGQGKERDKELVSQAHSCPTVQVIIPTLNEEKTIGGIIDKVNTLELNALLSVIVIDGGSNDSTLEICKRKNVDTVIQRGCGKGIAMREAVNLSNAEFVVFIDGDGTYSVDDLPLILMPLLEAKADMVVGTRIGEKMQKGSIDKLNMLGNNIFNKSINFAMGSAVTDSLSGYRALRREIFNELVLFSDRFEIEVEITVEAIVKGLKILEVPIKYRVREGSKTKLDPISDGTHIARALLFILMNVNPLKFFGLIALIFFTVALYPAYFVIIEKFTTGEVVSIPSVLLSSLLFVTAIMSIVVGLLSELVVRSRRRLEYMINKKINS